MIRWNDDNDLQMIEHYVWRRSITFKWLKGVEVTVHLVSQTSWWRTLPHEGLLRDQPTSGHSSKWRRHEDSFQEYRWRMKRRELNEKSSPDTVTDIEWDRLRVIDYQPPLKVYQISWSSHFIIILTYSFRLLFFLSSDPKQCEFAPIKNLILKTVDSVYENIRTFEGCRSKCINSPYRCFSFDFGADPDPKTGGICRTSHINTGSVLTIENPFAEMPGAVTYQLVSCMNVTVECLAHQMVAKIQTNRVFNGKIYSRTKPNSCMNDVHHSLDFHLNLPYNDVMCDVKQEPFNGNLFRSELVIQHHDRIVTHSDFGVSVLCRFDLKNRTITNGPLVIDGWVLFVLLVKCFLITASHFVSCLRIYFVVSVLFKYLTLVSLMTHDKKERWAVSRGSAARSSLPCFIRISHRDFSCFPLLWLHLPLVLSSSLSSSCDETWMNRQSHVLTKNIKNNEWLDLKTLWQVSCLLLIRITSKGSWWG